MHVQSKYDRFRWFPDADRVVAAGCPERCGGFKLLPWRRCGGGDTQEVALRPPAADHDDAVEAAIAVAGTDS
jgi:hypothetical protein